MRAYQIWDEAKKFFAASPGSKRHPEVAVAAKDLALALADGSLGEFLTSKYSLWLDLRTTDKDRLHGNGRRIDEGVTIKITKTAEAAGSLNVYLFLIMDAELDNEDGRFVQAAYLSKINKSKITADGSFGDNMRADGMWKNSFYPGFARRPLPGVLSTHRGPVPHHTT